MAVLALDATTRRVLWTKEGPTAAGLRALSLCAERDRVFYQKGRDVVCLELRTGRELWSASAPRLRLVCDGTILCADGESIVALSTDKGEVAWSRVPALTEIRDVFVADGSLWLGGFKPFPQKRGPSWGPYFVTQRDLTAGAVLRTIECENPGHHHRCYANKATDRYILAGRRGTEFIDLASGEIFENSWARGVCKYGVMPCNGLLYAPPHACACYVGTKVSGFSALAPGGDGTREIRAEDRLQRGPAYGSRPEGRGRAGPDWPTYRCDPARSGATKAVVPPQLEPAWRRSLGTGLSSPVVGAGRVFVASVDGHTLHALDADSGAPLWSYTADGRVDSPPTIAAGRVLFGCRDGSAYCLRASDGALAWRFRGARALRRVVAHGQLEAASPAHGSVLVQDGVAFLTVGRSSYMDGGIDLCRLALDTGELISRTQIYSPDPRTGKQPAQFAPSAMPGVRSDILAGDGDHIYLRDMVFDSAGRTGPQGRPHLLALTDFLDDSGPHRSYWMFGTKISISSGCSGQARGLVYGRLLVFDDATIYGYGRATVHWSNQLEDGPYRLFAVSREGGASRWEKPVGIKVRAMVLAGETLFVAGPVEAPVDGATCRLVVVSAADGEVLARHDLTAPPVFDGMAAVPDRLVLTLEDGSVVCMKSEQEMQTSNSKHQNSGIAAVRR